MNKQQIAVLSANMKGCSLNNPAAIRTCPEYRDAGMMIAFTISREYAKDDKGNLESIWAQSMRPSMVEYEANMSIADIVKKDRIVRNAQLMRGSK